MHLTLNIGLARKGQPDLGAGDVLLAVIDHGFTIHRYAGHTSDTERTLVVEVDQAAVELEASTFNLSRVLGQECIAVHSALFGGALIGPQAAAWGKFTPQFFINLDGTRLA